MRWKALGREPNTEDVEAATWAVYQRGLKVSGIEYIEAIAAAHSAGRKMAAFLKNYDVILSTTLPGLRQSSAISIRTAMSRPTPSA